MNKSIYILNNTLNLSKYINCKNKRFKLERRDYCTKINEIELHNKKLDKISQSVSDKVIEKETSTKVVNKEDAFMEDLLTDYTQSELLRLIELKVDLYYLVVDQFNVDKKLSDNVYRTKKDLIDEELTKYDMAAYIDMHDIAKYLNEKFLTNVNS